MVSGEEDETVRRLARHWRLGALALALAAWGCGDSAEENLDASSREGRVEAVRALGKRRSDAAAEKLASMVNHEDEETAVEAVRALGRMRRPSASRVLRKVVSENRRPKIRRDAAVELGYQRETQEAAEVLRRVLRTDPDPRVRGAAATGLANLKSLADVPLLVEVAETEDDAMVQGRAVGAVERMIGVRFGYDSKASVEERRQAVARMRAVAIRAAAVLQERERR